MGIVSVDEINEARASGIDREWKRTYTRSWRVVTDDATVGSYAARTAISVSLGNTYSDGVDTDTGAYVNDIQARCVDEDGRGWVVTAQYGPYDPNSNPADPTDRPLQVSWGGAPTEEIADVDKDGDPVVNSAYDYFDPPITRDFTRPVLTIVRCESEISFDLIDDYRDAVNSDTFLGKAAGFWKVAAILPVLRKDQDIGDYWEVTYEFHGNRDGWVKKVLDAGLRKLSASGTEREDILIAGVRASKAVFLDGAGDVLVVGDPPEVLEFHVQPELPFSVFNIDISDIPALAP